MTENLRMGQDQGCLMLKARIPLLAKAAWKDDGWPAQSVGPIGLPIGWSGRKAAVNKLTSQGGRPQAVQQTQEDR